MIIGHQKIIEFLNKSVASGRLAHAYLFAGPAHLGKRLAALEFAKTLQCLDNVVDSGDKASYFEYCEECASCRQINNSSHPDVLVVEPIKEEIKGKTKEKEISIEQIRQVRQKIGLFAYYGQYKIVIIAQAEKMSGEAANALLKTLEEPPDKTIIILISSAPKGLLPTIISRCLSIKFGLIKAKEISRGLEKIGCPKKSAEAFAMLVGGKPGLAMEYFRNQSLLREKEKEAEELVAFLQKDLSVKFKRCENMAKDIFYAASVLTEWQIFFRELMLEKLGCSDLVFSQDVKKTAAKNRISPLAAKKIIENIGKTKKILSNSSFNARLALEELVLNI